MPAGQIAERLDISQATLFVHLKELTDAGLTLSRQHGRMVIYAATTSPWMACCPSSQELLRGFVFLDARYVMCSFIRQHPRASMKRFGLPRTGSRHRIRMGLLTPSLTHRLRFGDG